MRFFQFAGINVFVHWSWFVVAVFQISRTRAYSSMVWNVYEYLALFGIVLLHEFGHAFACRQTGGKADEIILWPLGGVAFVQPPQRPGAQLWSIAAGPLVNVVLVPVLFAGYYFARQAGVTGDVLRVIFMVNVINGVLLAFNVLPIYPLDGGQMVRSLLWFWVGRARSLQISAILGFVGVAGLIGYAIWTESIWTGILAFFAGQRCLIGYREAQALQALARLPRHQDFACPSCREAPPGGPIWACGNCHNRFDTFSTSAVCPHCGTVHPQTTCIFCGNAHPIDQWDRSPRRGSGAAPVIDI